MTRDADADLAGGRAGSARRVLLVCEWHLRIVVAPLSRALAEEGHAVALLCRTHAYEFNGDSAERAAVLAETRSAGVRVWELPGAMASLRSLSSAITIRRALRAWGPDLVHADENYDPRLLMATAGYPCLVTVHNPRRRLGVADIGRLRSAVRAAWLRRATVLQVGGDALASEMRRVAPGTRAVAIPLGAAVRADPAPVPSRPVVLLFGRLVTNKGVEVLLDAMEIVRRERDDASLVIAGTGPAAASVPEDHPLIDLRLGYVPEHDVTALFEEARLVVLPYIDGSASGVGTTAVGMGIPTIAARVGVLDELTVEPGMAFEPGNAPALAAAILRYIDHGDRLRRRVLDQARRTRSWELVARRQSRLYDEVLAAE